jgi:uncharacterized cupredoxin-like copper-binding protein
VQANRSHQRRRGQIVCAAILIVLSSCSADARTSVGPTVDVTLKDFSIRTSTPTVAAGRVSFEVENRGPATHEFVVVRTDLPDDDLPIAADGLSVDEEALAGVGEISDVRLSTGYTLDLNLAPGRYVFFCNLEGHYLGGMSGGLLVLDDA